MVIENAKIYGEDKIFRDGSLYIREDRFSEEKEEGPVIDAHGCYAIPGLIDLHFHGCMGYDFSDGTIEAIERIAEYEASMGITGMAPATMTLPEKKLEQILSTGAEYRKKEASGCFSKGKADLLGINMEGPFISKVKKGAQDPRHIIPCNIELGRRFLEVSEGLVKFLGIAPEENPNFLDFIKEMKDRVCISLAHTNADYDTAMAAIQAGARHAVHLYNAMPIFTHRDPGVVGAVADSPHVCAEMICDGIHIHPSVVRATFRMLGPERIIFISDSMRAAGMPDGRYTLGGQDVDVKGKRAVLASDGALAGSASNLMDCLKTAVRQMGIPLETAIACATRNPAKSLGVYDMRGSISPGKKADLVLLDPELSVKLVIKDGAII
ncbi:N-acetylglucosamine-6-phosphate deacetylase [Lachnospiraceae bacterium 62-35]